MLIVPFFPDFDRTITSASPLKASRICDAKDSRLLTGKNQSNQRYKYQLQILHSVG
jgi:hypothetical protein